MSRNQSWAIAVISCIGLSASLLAEPQCRIQHVAGVWSASSQGWTILTAQGPWPANETVPVVGLAAFSIDPAGKLSGSGTIVFAGLVVDYEMAGTLEISPDCTGVLQYVVKMKGLPDLPGYIERVVLDVFRQEMAAVSVRTPISKPMWVTRMKRISTTPGAVTWPQLPPQ